MGRCKCLFGVFCWAIMKAAIVAGARGNAVDNPSQICSRMLQASVDIQPSLPAVLAGRPEHRQLDIVISHYWASNFQDVIQVWEQILNLPTVKTRKPYLFLYCKSSTVADNESEWFHNHGEVQHLENVGRESHTFVWHIVQNLDNLANHTLFHQAIPDNVDLLIQRLGQLSPSTGLLALSLTGKCTCTTCVLHHLPKVREIWAMVRHNFCAPADEHAVFMRGAFLVSSHRIRSVPMQIYETLLQYSEAPDGHWVHAEHSEDWARSSSNPLSGHVFERSWNILFNCLDPHIVDDCQKCDSSEGSCLPSACQCSD